MVATPSPAVQIERVTKSFHSISALSEVSLALAPGSVHGLVGANGAGKSTLIGLLSGVIQPDSGQIRVAGRVVRLTSPLTARRAGIVTIYQELSVIPELTVAENIALGNEPTWGGPVRVVARGRMAARARSLLRRVGADDLNPSTLVSRLSVAKKELVEIARALSIDAAVLVMDEPTSSLSRSDSERLLQIIEQLRANGTAILFVSHRLEEVRRVADEVTVLRGGVVVDHAAAGERMSSARMVEAMTGKPMGGRYPARRGSAHAVVLRVSHLSKPPTVRDISFDLRAGEVLGFFGLVGAGRTELMRLICGIDAFESGSIEVGGVPVRFKHPGPAIRSGLLYLPEDRKSEGLVMPRSARENIVLSVFRRMSTFGFVREKRVRQMSDALSTQTRIDGNLDRAVINLSGGNQQKVVIARGLAAGPRIFILDEPTRGIDVAAKYDIYGMIQNLAEQNLAIVVVSSDVSEIANVAHRAVVMASGTIVTTLEGPQLTEPRLLDAAFGKATVDSPSLH